MVEDLISTETEKEKKPMIFGRFQKKTYNLEMRNIIVFIIIWIEHY